jgi:hypothetical protein
MKPWTSCYCGSEVTYTMTGYYDEPVSPRLQNGILAVRSFRGLWMMVPFTPPHECLLKSRFGNLGC